MGLWEDIKSANNWGNDRADDIGNWFGNRGAGAADELDAIGRYVMSAPKPKKRKVAGRRVQPGDVVRPTRQPTPGNPGNPGVPFGPGLNSATGQPEGPRPEQPYDYFAAADKLLTAMGMGQSVGGLADVGSTIASYNQARDAARKNAAAANEQIGVYGQQGQAAINQSGGASEEAALRNVAAVQGTNAQLQAAPDEGVKRAQDIAAAQGVQLSPGILEDAARSKGIAQNVGAGIQEGAVGGVRSATQSKNNALQSSANATQGARNITQGNLDNLLAELGLNEAKDVNAVNASNAGAQSAYAAQRAEMLFGLAGQIDPATGRPRTPEQEAALAQRVQAETTIDPRTQVMDEVGAYTTKHGKSGGNQVAVAGSTDATDVFYSAVTAPELGEALGLMKENLAVRNEERAKKKLKPLSEKWLVDKLTRYYGTPTEVTETTSR